MGAKRRFAGVAQKPEGISAYTTLKLPARVYDGHLLGRVDGRADSSGIDVLAVTFLRLKPRNTLHTLKTIGDRIPLAFSVRERERES